MNNINAVLEFSQGKIQSNYQSVLPEFTWFPVSFINSLSVFNGKSREQLVEFLKDKLTPYQLRIFEYLYKFAFTADKIFPSQKKIAQALGMCRDTVTEAVAVFHRLGIIYKAERQYSSNRYYINDNFLKSPVRSLLMSFFVNMSFALFSLSLLLPKAHQMDLPALLILSKEKRLNNPIHPRQNNPTCGGSLPIWTGFRKSISKRESFSLMMGDVLIQQGIIKVQERKCVLNKDSLELIQKNTDKLPLTLHGMLKLSVFPVPVIEHLLSKPFNCEANDSFAYLFRIATNFAKQASLGSPDFDLFNKIAAQLKVTWQPLIDAELLTQLKESQQQEQMHKAGKKIATPEQKQKAFSAAESRYKSAAEAQQKARDNRIRLLGFEPDELSFYWKNQLLKGNITPEALRQELSKDLAVSYNNSALSNNKPSIPEEFFQTRRELVIFLESQLGI